MEKLGDDRSIKVIIVGNKEVEQSLYGQLVSGKVIASGLDEELAKEAKRAGIYLKLLILKNYGLIHFHFLPQSVFPFLL